MKHSDDELNPVSWIDSFNSRFPSLTASMPEDVRQQVRQQFLERTLREHNETSLGALLSEGGHREYITLWRINIEHQKALLRNVLTGTEIKTWDRAFSANTPRDTFEAFASMTRSRNDSVLLTAPSFLCCSNFSDFLVWRLSQHGKRPSEFNDEQADIFYLFMLHIYGAIIGSGTLCPPDNVHQIRPSSEGTMLAKSVSFNAMLFFILAREFSHLHLQDHSHQEAQHQEARVDNSAQIQEDELALNLLVRHIFYNGPAMGLNHSVIPMMLLAPFSCFSLCKTVLSVPSSTDVPDTVTHSSNLSARFASLHKGYFDILRSALGDEGYLAMQDSLANYFFSDIPAIGVWLFGEVDVFAKILALISKQVNK